MSDGVKFIFKSLIRVPVIIFTAFFILNIFLFFFMYFKLLGISYVVMQEVVDKNYIGPNQLTQLQGVLRELDEITVVNGGTSGIIVGVDVNGRDVFVNADGAHYAAKDGGGFDELSKADVIEDKGYALEKCQYGQTRHVGIRLDYKIAWPLDVNNIKRYNNRSDIAPDGTIKYEKHEVVIPISITYDVPGLKYYADLY